EGDGGGATIIMKLRAFSWFGAAGCLLATAGAAAAEAEQGSGPDPSAYTEAIGQAVKEFEAARFEAALSAFKAAHALQPSARTFRGIGLASYSLGDFVEARRAFERALIDPRRPLTTESRHEVEFLLRETARRTGRFELRLEPGDAA